MLKFQISKEIGRKMLFRGWFLALFNKKMTLWVQNLTSILIVYDKINVTLQRHAYAVPYEKDARMGGTLHNVKASSMLCLLASWNIENFNCVSRTMSEVNAVGMQQWYPGVWIRAYYILKAHFPEVRATYRRRQSLYKFTHKGFSRTSRANE